MPEMPDMEVLSELLQNRMQQPSREEMLEGQRLSALYMRAAYPSDSGTDVTVRHLLDFMDSWTAFVNDGQDIEVDPVVNREIGKFMSAGGEMLGILSDLGAFRMGKDMKTWCEEQKERERQERIAQYGHIGDTPVSEVSMPPITTDEANDEVAGMIARQEDEQS